MSQGRYRRLYARIYRHPAFKALPPAGRLLALYLLSGPQSNRIGLFYFSVNTAAEDLDVSADTVRKGLADISEAFGWLYDAVARVVYVPTWWRWNDPGSPKILQGNLKDLSEIPPCGLVDAFASNTQYVSETLIHTFHEAIAIRMTKSTPIQEQYQKQKQEQEPSALRAGNEEQVEASAGAEDEHVSQIVKETLAIVDIGRPIEELLDSFRHTARARGIDPKRFTDRQVHTAFLRQRQSSGFSSVASMARAGGIR